MDRYPSVVKCKNLVVFSLFSVQIFRLQTLLLSPLTINKKCLYIRLLTRSFTQHITFLQHIQIHFSTCNPLRYLQQLEFIPTTTVGFGRVFIWYWLFVHFLTFSFIVHVLLRLRAQITTTTTKHCDSLLFLCLESYIKLLVHGKTGLIKIGRKTSKASKICKDIWFLHFSFRYTIISSIGSYANSMDRPKRYTSLFGS